MPRWLGEILTYLLDFSNVLNASISATWLILAILLLRPLMKRMPKWIHVALWGIVALRLLMPFSIESIFSLIPSTETLSDQLLQAGPVPGSNPAYLEIVTNPNFGPEVTVELDASISSFQIDLLFLTFPWLAGVGAMLLYTLTSYLSLRGRLRTAVILRDNIFRCERVSSPFVLGILKPRIYLPCAMDGKDLPHVIAHEQAHIQRRDHWWKPLGFLLLSVHWFNPLMWVAYWLLCRDIELACDEKVIARLGSDQRADYTQALVACSVGRHMIAACPLAFGEVGVKERVRNVMNYRKPAFWIMVTAVAVCITVAVCFLTDPPIRTLEELPDIRHRKYGVVDLLYDSPWYSFSVVPQENSPEYMVTEQMELLTRGEIANGGEWTNVGTLEEISLTRENFDKLFFSDDGWIKESPSYIRKNTARAWQVIYNQEILYYLLQWKNGELYLAYGYYDYAEKDDPGSDDTSIRWLFCLAPDEGTGAVLRGRILEIQGGYYLVEPVDGSSPYERIQVAIKNLDSSPEPRVGDIIEIEYDGLIQEIYPPILPGVYRIRVVEQEPAVLVPTETDLQGLQAGVLLVPMDGQIYRYAVSDYDPQNITAESLLDTFTEEDIDSAVVWNVYSLKQYPDLSAVLMVSPTAGAILCRYSPPLRCADSALEDADTAGHVIMEEGTATRNLNIWHAFYDQTRQGKPASVTVSRYMTLDPARCDPAYYEAFRQDYPMMYTYCLQYDGEGYTLSSDDGNEKYYQYLMHYSDWNLPGENSAQGKAYDQYVLTNDDSVSWAQLFAGLASSQAGAYTDHFTVYVECVDEAVRTGPMDYGSLFAAYADGEQDAESILRSNTLDALAYCMEQFEQGILEGLSFEDTGPEMCMYDFWNEHTRLLLKNILECPQQDWQDWSEYVKRMYALNGYEAAMATIFDETMFCERLYVQMTAEPPEGSESTGS